MGGVFVNYFNRFGRVWQVYVQADGEFRTSADNVGQFYVRNACQRHGAALDAGVDGDDVRAGIHHALQRLPVRPAVCIREPGYSSGQAMTALEEVFAADDAARNGL